MIEFSFSYISVTDVFLRLLCAILLGACLGIDRELRHRRVGVRTYMLVALGAAGFSIVTMELANATVGDGFGADPTRITQGLIGAIGFLGAGAIIQGRGQVGGMATAASLWTSGAVGMAAGLGFLLHALIITAFAASILILSKLLPNRGQADRPDCD